MTEVPKHLQIFIARDIIYLIGGGCVVGSFLYACGKLPDGKEASIALNILAAGVAYVLGMPCRIFSVFSAL